VLHSTYVHVSNPWAKHIWDVHPTSQTSSYLKFVPFVSFPSSKLYLFILVHLHTPRADYAYDLDLGLRRGEDEPGGRMAALWDTQGVGFGDGVARREQEQSVTRRRGFSGPSTQTQTHDMWDGIVRGNRYVSISLIHLYWFLLVIFFFYLRTVLLRVIDT
jgi:hypothetical protein